MKNFPSWRAMPVARFAMLIGIWVQLISARADVHVWAGVGLTGNWSIPANWSGNNPPAAGETAPVQIVFPAGTPRLTNTNNIGGLVIDSIFFYASNATIYGAGPGTNITLRGSGYSSGGYGTNNVLTGTLNITLSNTVPFALTAPGDLTIKSHLQGPGGFSLAGTGTLSLSAITDNTFTGAVSVINGTLNLQNGFLLFSSFIPSLAIPGPLNIGDNNLSDNPQVYLLADSQIATNSALSFQPTGTLRLNSHSNMVGSMTMTGGAIYGNGSSGNGTLCLNGNVAISYSPLVTDSYIAANINLGGVTRTFDVGNAGLFSISGSIDDGTASGARGTAGIIKTSTGQLLLSGGNTYNGPTTINGGTVSLYNNSALGLTNSGTTVASGASLQLGFGVSIGNEPLTLNGSGFNGTGALIGNYTNSWGGQITLASDSVVSVNNTNSQITLFGVITGSGGLTKEGPGTLVYDGLVANTYAGNTIVHAGLVKLFCGYYTGVVPNLTFVPAQAVPGYLEIGDDYFSMATVKFLGNAQISSSAATKVRINGTLDLNNCQATCGPLVLDGGVVYTESGLLTLNGDVFATNNYGYIEDHLSLGGVTRQFNIGSGVGVEVDASIINGGAPAGITKVGAGELILANSNAFTGAVTVNAGVLGAFHPQCFGPSSGITVNSGGEVASLGYSFTNHSITLNGTGPYGEGALTSGGGTTWYGPVVVASDSALGTTATQRRLTINGPITGPGGLLVGTGAGNSLFEFAGSSDNTLSGIVNVVDATNTLLLNKSSGAAAISGPLVIGTTNASYSYDTNFVPFYPAVVLLGANNQIDNSASITVCSSGLLNLSNYNETIGPLSFYDGTIQGNGMLTLGNNVTNYGSDNFYYQGGSIYCPLSLGGQTRIFNGTNGFIRVYGPVSDGGASAGITKVGIWEMELDASNSYSGLTLVNEGQLAIFDNNSLGTTNSGTVVASGATLELNTAFSGYIPSAVSDFAEPLTFTGTPNGTTLVAAGTNRLTGPLTINSNVTCHVYDSSAVLTFAGPVSGPGGLTLGGFGLMRFTGASTNTFAGQMVTSLPTLELAKTNGIAASGGLSISSGVTRYLAANQIGDTAAVSVDQSGTLNLNNYSDTIGDLNGLGTVNIGAGILTVGGTNAVDYFFGKITGVGGELDKIGTSALILSGTNTYTSGTLVKSGVLMVNGSQPASDVYVYTNATLLGFGTIGSLYANGGTVTPGDGAVWGTLTCSNATFNPGSTFNVKLQGTNAYSQLNVRGNVIINSPVNLAATKSFAGAVSNKFTIINNDQSDLILGSFNGLSGGTTFSVNGTTLQIAYLGGSGNDCVLTETVQPTGPKITCVTKGPGGLTLTGPALPRANYIFQANTNLGTTNWITIGNVAMDDSTTFMFTDIYATNYPMRFYRVLWP